METDEALVVDQFRVAELPAMIVVGEAAKEAVGDGNVLSWAPTSYPDPCGIELP